MFSRGSSSGPKPPSFPSAIPAAASSYDPPANAPAASNYQSGHSGSFGSGSIVGTDLTLIGDKVTVICRSSLLISGIVHGDVNGDEIIVGDTGQVYGTITARSVQVHGHVQGAIKGLTITLHPTAHVDGDVYKQTLIIAEGAHLDGRVRKVNDPSEVAPNLDASAFSAKA